MSLAARVALLSPLRSGPSSCMPASARPGSVTYGALTLCFHLASWADVKHCRNQASWHAQVHRLDGSRAVPGPLCRMQMLAIEAAAIQAPGAQSSTAAAIDISWRQGQGMSECPHVTEARTRTRSAAAQGLAGCLRQVLVAAVRQGTSVCCLGAALALACCRTSFSICRYGTGEVVLLLSSSPDAVPACCVKAGFSHGV